jgi:hypothetical protein
MLQVAWQLRFRAIEQLATIGPCRKRRQRDRLDGVGIRLRRATKQREISARAAGQPIPDWSSIGGQNDEAKVMQLVLDHVKPLASPPPTLVVFITDGGLYRGREIEAILRTASDLPVFWQFVGIGRATYGILEKLDTLSGRTVDNAGFFAVDDLDEIQDDELYARILSEFPSWLRNAAAAGIAV